MNNMCNRLDYGCKISAFLSIGAQKRAVSEEIALYFDVGQKMPIRVLDQQQRARLLIAFALKH